MDTKIPKFRRCVIQNFPFIEQDFDALTDYGLLSKVVEYLNSVITQTNTTTDNMQALQNAFTTLQNYVDHYFDNLDVQTEINNKLDDMAEAGTLQEIIAEYLGLGTMFTFNTVAEMVASEALITGSKCQTLGKETINDGYGAIYAIGDSGEILLDNGKYATMIGNTQGNNYINEITITTGRANDTDYTLATIPLNDSDGNLIELSVNEDATVTPLGYAGKNFTTITTNAGLTRQNAASQWKQGAVISNGVALHGDLCDVAPASYLSYIGFKADRSVLDFPATTTTDVMISQGVKNAFLTFGKIVNNGVVDIDQNVDATQQNPWLNVGVKNDGTIVILASDGRTFNNVGMTMTEVATLMLGLGCTNVWRCDGGGSTSLIYKGSKQNRNIDEHATLDRDIHVTLNFKKPTIDKQTAEVYSFIGKERQLLNKQIRDDMKEATQHSLVYCAETALISGLNEIAATDTYQDIYYAGINRAGDYITMNRKSGSTRNESFQMNKLGLYRFIFTGQVTGGTTFPHNFIVRAVRKSDSSVLATMVNGKANADAINPTLMLVYNNTNADGEAIKFEMQGEVGMRLARLYITAEYIGLSV